MFNMKNNKHEEFKASLGALLDVLDTEIAKAQGYIMRKVREATDDIGDLLNDDIARKDFLKATKSLYEAHGADYMGAECPYMSERKKARIDRVLAGTDALAVQSLTDKVVTFYVDGKKLRTTETIAPALSAYQVNDIAGKDLRGFQSRDYLPAF